MRFFLCLECSKPQPVIDNAKPAVRTLPTKTRSRLERRSSDSRCFVKLKRFWRANEILVVCPVMIGRRWPMTNGRKKSALRRFLLFGQAKRLLDGESLLQPVSVDHNALLEQPVANCWSQIQRKRQRPQGRGKVWRLAKPSGQEEFGVRAS